MHYNKKISPTMLEKKRLHFDLEVKTLDKDGRFTGYASVFNIIDNHNDIITRGAFAETIKHRSREIKLLWQHKQDEPIGVFEEIFEDELGLYVQGRLLLDVARAREAYALLKQGALNGLSIGYSPTQYKIDAKNGTRILSEVELWEISLVTFPANASANITVVKQAFTEVEGKTAIRSGEMIQLQDALDRAITSLKT